MTNDQNQQHIYYKAHLARDARFDGKFFVAVKSTRIYCRPTCPARKAKLENLTFYKSAMEAENAGFRACIRCRPESAPGSAAWRGTSATVHRAMRIIDSSLAEELSIPFLCEHLGVSDRWLRELFRQHLGASPQDYIMHKKLALAKNLLEHTPMRVADIAFEAGFKSIRRFNDAFKKKFQLSPSQCRKTQTTQYFKTIYLAYRPPFHWQHLLDFFKFRCINGMEKVSDNSYERCFNYRGKPGWFRASLADNHRLKIDFILPPTLPIFCFINRIKDILDLDCDPVTIENHLHSDQQIKPLLKHFSGIRIPGCFNPFELIVRAIVGQRISVKAAQSILENLVQHFGKSVNFPHCELQHTFPSTNIMENADLSHMGLTQTKIYAIKEVAKQINSQQLRFDGLMSEEDIRQQLLSIKGIGPWTVEYIALRLLKDPNAFPEKDLELQKQITKHQLDPSKWQPWRGYVVMMLFGMGAGTSPKCCAIRPS